EPAAPSPPSTPAQLIESSRSRNWDRLLVGLTHLPDRQWLTVKPVGVGKLFEVPTGKLLGRIRSGAPVMLSAGPDDTVQIVSSGLSGAVRAARLEAGGGAFRLEGRSYTGAFLCWRADQRIACAVDTPLETYLRGVLPGEVPSSWPLEAQKAL